ncbi:MAG: hypothetical protein HYZ08_00005, partial [Candidatus Kerfeldbacteria bacterium]|nr:hypothetical protein [Candidatus Kerfeldbacteria bacterium]
MFTTAHAVVAITIAHQTGDPMLGLVLGVLSHLIFDAIPHGDRNFFAVERHSSGKFNVVKDQKFF